MLQDTSGSATVRIGEKTVLSLSNMPDKETFIKAVTDGDPVSPTIIAAKIARKVTTQSADDSSPSVNLRIVDAAAQTLNQSRTQTSIGLIPLLRTFSGLTSAILPATIDMIVPSKIYPLVVQYPGTDVDAQPCSKIWLLIKATQKSACSDKAPYTVTTEDIEDALDLEIASIGADQSAAKEKVKPKLVSMCTFANMPSLRLTPARGKPQYALIVVTSFNECTLFAER